MKELKTLLCILLLAMLLATPTMAQVPQADNTQRIFDYADLLSTQDENRLTSQALEAGQKYNMDILILTVDDTDGLNVLDYAMDFYYENDFGVGEDRNGVMLLVDMDSRTLQMITQGTGMDYFGDDAIDNILDHIASSFSDGDYYQGFRTFIQDCGIQVEAIRGRLPFRERYGIGARIGIALCIGVAGGFVVLIILVLIHRRSLRRAPAAQAYLSQGGANFTHRSDIFLHTHTSRTAIPKSSGSNGGGGGFGGGGGSSVGSRGGRSFGGGSRKF